MVGIALPEYKYTKNNVKKSDRDYLYALDSYNIPKNNVNFWEEVIEDKNEETKIIDGKKKFNKTMPTENKSVSDIPDQIGSFESKVAGTVLVGGDGNKNASDLGYTVMPENERISQGIPKRSKNDTNAPYGSSWRGRVRPFKAFEIALRSAKDDDEIKTIDNENLNKDNLLWDTEQDRKILKTIKNRKEKSAKRTETITKAKKEVERALEKKEKANEEFLKEIEDIDNKIKNGKMNVLTDATELVKSKRRIIELSAQLSAENLKENRASSEGKNMELEKLEEEKMKDKKEKYKKDLKGKGERESEENTSESKEEDSSFESMQILILIERLKKQLIEKGISEEEIDEIIRRLSGLKIKDFLMVRDLIKKEYNIR